MPLVPFGFAFIVMRQRQYLRLCERSTDDLKTNRQSCGSETARNSNRWEPQHVKRRRIANADRTRTRPLGDQHWWARQRRCDQKINIAEYLRAFPTKQIDLTTSLHINWSRN